MGGLYREQEIFHLTTWDLVAAFFLMSKATHIHADSKENKSEKSIIPFKNMYCKGMGNVNFMAVKLYWSNEIFQGSERKKVCERWRLKFFIYFWYELFLDFIVTLQFVHIQWMIKKTLLLCHLHQIIKYYFSSVIYSLSPYIIMY